MDRTLNELETMRSQPLPYGTAWPYDDPMGVDLPSDRRLSTTARAVARVAYVASEAAARFERCGTRADAMAWMSSPRDLFGGRAAIEACLELDDCARGVLAHMLEADPDVDAEELDDLIGSGGFPVPPSMVGESVEPAVAVNRLYSCRTRKSDATGSSWCFDAFLAEDVADARRSLAVRHGRAAAVAAIVREGFDRSDPYVEAMVSPALADAIELAQKDPAGVVASGLDVRVVQRLAS